MTSLPCFPARAGGALEACAAAQVDQALEVDGVVLDELAGAGVPGQADPVLAALQRLQEDFPGCGRALGVDRRRGGHVDEVDLEQLVVVGADRVYQVLLDPRPAAGTRILSPSCR